MDEAHTLHQVLDAVTALAGVNPQPSTLNPQPSTLNPQPSTLNPQPSTLNPKPSTPNPKPRTPNPKPSTLNPQPQTINSKPQALDPEPQILNPYSKSQDPEGAGRLGGHVNLLYLGLLATVQRASLQAPYTLHPTSHTLPCAPYNLSLIWRNVGAIGTFR